MKTTITVATAMAVCMCVCVNEVTMRMEKGMNVWLVQTSKCEFNRYALCFCVCLCMCALICVYVSFYMCDGRPTGEDGVVFCFI